MNTIQYSANRNFAGILHSERPEVHQDTNHIQPKRRRWDYYYPKCLTRYDNEAKTLYLSLCIDIVGEESECILRYLKDIRYIERLGATINTSILHFKSLSNLSEEANIAEQVIVAPA